MAGMNPAGNTKEQTMRGKEQVETKKSITELLSQRSIEQVKAIPVASLFNVSPKKQGTVISTIYFIEQGHTRFEVSDLITTLSAIPIGAVEDLEILCEIRKALKELKAQQ